MNLVPMKMPIYIYTYIYLPIYIFIQEPQCGLCPQRTPHDAPVCRTRKHPYAALMIGRYIFKIEKGDAAMRGKGPWERNCGYWRGNGSAGQGHDTA